MHLNSTVILTLVGYFLFSAAAGAMLPPLPAQERGLYGWLYRFAQVVAANAHRLAEARFGPSLVPSYRPLEEALAHSSGAATDVVTTTTHIDRVEASTQYERQP